MERHGKQLAVMATDGRLLVVHLGMTGSLTCTRGPASPRDQHVHVVWTLDDGARLVFRDPRRFGGIWTFADRSDLIANRWAQLGPDAVSVTGRELVSTLGASRRSIKAALLDQRAVAGVGNIYADEALFDARIHPLTPCVQLRPRDWKQLARSIRVIIAAAIEAGGSTVRDYVDGVGAPGRYAADHMVYGRAGLPCARCGKSLGKKTIAQRTSVFCSSCQARGISGLSTRNAASMEEAQR
jgi:formamidopyrimidine-DNA glycosylase